MCSVQQRVLVSQLNFFHPAVGVEAEVAAEALNFLKGPPHEAGGYTGRGPLDLE